MLGAANRRRGRGRSRRYRSWAPSDSPSALIRRRTRARARPRSTPARAQGSHEHAAFRRGHYQRAPSSASGRASWLHDVDEGVAGDPPPEALLPHRQRTGWLRSPRRALLALEPFARPLVRRVMDALAGLGDPLDEMPLEPAEALERAAGEPVGLDVLHADSVLPLVRARYGAKARGTMYLPWRKARYVGVNPTAAVGRRAAHGRPTSRSCAGRSSPAPSQPG